MKARTLEHLDEGTVLMGTVKNITEYGAFVDLGGIDGLLHITDMSWGRVNHPSEMVAVGDEIKVKVSSSTPILSEFHLGSSSARRIHGFVPRHTTRLEIASVDRLSASLITVHSLNSKKASKV